VSWPQLQPLHLTRLGLIPKAFFTHATSVEIDVNRILILKSGAASLRFRTSNQGRSLVLSRECLGDPAIAGFQMHRHTLHLIVKRTTEVLPIKRHFDHR
jgi:hypothetical protein